jgi:hypothetical protein
MLNSPMTLGNMRQNGAERRCASAKKPTDGIQVVESKGLSNALRHDACMVHYPDLKPK